LAIFTEGNYMKVLLFAIRTSHKKFFIELKKEDKSLFDIVFPKYRLPLSLRGLKMLHRVDLEPAIVFAIEEFRVKVTPLPRSILRLYFKSLALFHYLRYYPLIDEKYDAILLWNGGKCRQRVAIEIAKLHGVLPLFFENGLLPDRLVLDKEGINADNSVPRDRAFFEVYSNPLTLPDSLIPRRPKNQKKFQTTLEPLPKEFIFVPFQVDSDTQIITNSRWIQDMRQLFDTIEKLSRSTVYNFVLKEHPSSSRNYPDLHQRAKELEGISFANGYATQELIEKSMAVITINSTVGVESLLFKKRVLVLGDAFYRIEGITKGVDDDEMLYAVVSDLENWILEEPLVENFLKYLYYDYLITKDEKLYNRFYNFIKKVIS
jgi:capsular polysaccharide export protein